MKGRYTSMEQKPCRSPVNNLCIILELMITGTHLTSRDTVDHPQKFMSVDFPWPHQSHVRAASLLLLLWAIQLSELPLFLASKHVCQSLHVKGAHLCFGHM